MTAYDHWARGYGVIAHRPETCDRIAALARRLVEGGDAASEDAVFACLAAADALDGLGGRIAGRTHRAAPDRA